MDECSKSRTEVLAELVDALLAWEDAVRTLPDRLPAAGEPAPSGDFEAERRALLARLERQNARLDHHEADILTKDRQWSLAAHLTFGEPAPEGQGYLAYSQADRDADYYGTSVVGEWIKAAHAAELSVNRCCALAEAALERPKTSDSEAILAYSVRWLRFDEAYAMAQEDAVARLCGYWDRVAQLLSFVFFNVREFDHDVFTAVIDRVRSNWAKHEPLFAIHEAWGKLWHYRDRGGDEGYKWLSSRRNALTHSVHMPRAIREALRSNDERPGDAIWARIVAKVSAGSPEEEKRRMTSHLKAMHELRDSVTDLCRFGLDTYGLRPWRLRPQKGRG